MRIGVQIGVFYGVLDEDFVEGVFELFPNELYAGVLTGSFW